MFMHPLYIGLSPEPSASPKSRLLRLRTPITTGGSRSDPQNLMSQLYRRPGAEGPCRPELNALANRIGSGDTSTLPLWLLVAWARGRFMVCECVETQSRRGGSFGRVPVGWVLFVSRIVFKRIVARGIVAEKVFGNGR